MLQIPLISFALFLVAAVTAGLAIYAMVNIKVRGGLEFSLLMVALTLYIAGFGMELLSDSSERILFWLRIEYIGISTIPAFCILLAIRLAGNEQWVKSWLVRSVLFFPILTIILYYTNAGHLFYTKIGDIRSPIANCYELDISKGPWYYLNVIYLNLSLLTAVILFIRKLGKDPVERRQSWLLIGGSLGPWIAHLAYQLQLTGGFDISPFGFLITAPLFAWGVFGNYMVFLLPKARDSVYQSLGDTVIILDNRSNLIDFNRTAANLFKNLNRSMVGRQASEIFGQYPEIMESTGSIEDHRSQVKMSIGKVNRSFILTTSCVTTRHGQRLGIILALHEITDQMFLLDNLRESEEKYRLIFDHAPVGVFQYDSAARITTCNDAFVKIIGSSREVINGLNLLNLPDQRMVAAISDSLMGKIGYYEHEYHSVTALKVTPVRGFFSPITAKDGQIRGGVGIVEDFTERYQADSQIKYREEFESIMIDLELDFLNTEIGNIDETFDRGLMRLGTYCNVDRAYIFRFNYAEGTMSSTNEWCANGINPEIRSLQSIPLDYFSRHLELLKRSEIVHLPDISELDADWQSEKSFLQKKGIRSMIVVPVEVAGELMGFAGFGSVRQLRSWNKDEIALLKVLGQIFASVIKRKEAHEELIRARDKAEEANRVKSTFLANMSHEIRTPLNGILGFAELILAESEDPLVIRYTDIILSSGNRLLQTLSQILDLSRVESGKMDLVIEPVNVDKSIDDVIYLFTPNARKKGLFIERQHGGPKMVLKLDDQLFRNSLTNLLSNAIKFTDKGGITISTATDMINGKRFGTIRIADTGIGIPEKYFDSIFEDFKQVSEGVKRSHEGSGLGLSLTKKFVELSGGKIKVESLPGFGATFILSFPDPIIE